VGSLLRPPAIRQLFERIYAGKETQIATFVDEASAADLTRLNQLAEEAIRGVVRRQIDIGLDVVSDGELRRGVFENSLWEGLEGIGPNPRKMEFTDKTGEIISPPTTAMVTGRVRKVRSPAAEEASFLASITDFPFKVTLPAPSMLLFPETGLAEAAYRDRDEMVADMVGVYRELVADAVAAGARYVQFDFPIYPLLVDPHSRAALAELGEDADSLLTKAIAADAAVTEGVPDEVTVALHLCRGNYRSHWFLEGSLAPLAERMFAELPFDTFLFEWDDVGREGDYEPIRYVPPGKIMVLGLVSTKVPELENDDDTVRRLEQASRYLPLDQLAISPQCGFASVWEGNLIDEDTQWRKLELVARVADRVWSRG
jgi:methionine synthase II (cobalamin-independent)